MRISNLFKSHLSLADQPDATNAAPHARPEQTSVSAHLPGDLIRRISEGVFNSHAFVGRGEKQDFLNMASVSVHWRRALQLKVDVIQVDHPEDLNDAVKAYPNAAIVSIPVDLSRQTAVNLSALKHLPNLKSLVFSSAASPTTAQLQTLELHPEAKGVEVCLTASNESCNSTVMAHFASVGAIEELTFAFSHAEVDIESIKPLKAKLVALDLESTFVSGEELKHLQGFSKLKTLVLQDCRRLRNEHLGLLKDLPSLTFLDLSSTRLVDNTGLNHLCQLRSLEKLKLPKLEIGTTEAAALKNLSNLKHLIVNEYITNCDAVLHAVGELPNLESLHLGLRKDRVSVSAQGVAQLKSLKKLQTFVCQSNTFNDAALKELEGIPSLRDVRLLEGTVSDQAIASFKETNKKARLVLQ